jgi:hypothetical protein
MNSPFAPSFQGVYRPDALAPDFIPRLAARIRAGLFPMASPSRNQYEIVEQTEDFLHFRSNGFLTGINIGLNDVRLRVDKEAGEICYSVTYWVWAQYSIGLGLLLGIALAGVRPFLPERGAVNPILYWPFIAFWCLVWPWVLIVLHKKPAVRCLNGIFQEVNASRVRQP